MVCVGQVYYVMGTSDSLVRKGRKRVNNNNRMVSREVGNGNISISNAHSLKALKFLKFLFSRIQSMGT